MGYRGSKSVYVKDIVKEQRVDGSCFGSKPKLRCTLMGGESRYLVKIPSKQIKNIIVLILTLHQPRVGCLLLLQ
jgi:hypothetical protein